MQDWLLTGQAFHIAGPGEKAEGWRISVAVEAAASLLVWPRACQDVPTSGWAHRDLVTSAPASWILVTSEWASLDLVTSGWVYQDPDPALGRGTAEFPVLARRGGAGRAAARTRTGGEAGEPGLVSSYWGWGVSVGLEGWSGDT